MPWSRAIQRVLSRSLHRLYRAAPIFGRMRGAVAIIAQDGEYVVIERADGLGLSFPGGMLWPWESPERGVRREVREETGLVVGSLELLFAYDDDAVIPTRTTVFRAAAEGVPRGSWEGRVLRVSLDELRRGVSPAEARVVQYLLSPP
jgi:8-oxo-dGTP pyrophosphatase MutT (NUDIX family)